MVAPIADAAAAAAADPRTLLRLALRLNLHPEADLHPSWLPPSWPCRHRRLSQLGPAGREVLGRLLRSRDGLGLEPDYAFESRLKRLALLDGPSLRRLAVLLGFCAHAPLLKQRGAVAAQLRRQARRYGSDLARFLRDRVPHMTEVRMNPATLQSRPAGVGKAVVNRGYRLLLGAVACEGDAVLERVRRKLPYRVSLLRVPRLEPAQRSQVEELLLLCIVPERLPQWDWLF